MAVQAGTALGGALGHHSAVEGGHAADGGHQPPPWDACPPPPDSKAGLQGALFNLCTPDAKYRHHQPNTTHLDPPPPRPWP